MKRTLALTAAVLLCFAAGAHAQTEAAISLGLAVSTADPIGPLGIGGTGMGPILRVKMGTGLGPVIGFNWYNIGAEAMAGGQRVYLGRLRLHPIMLGVGYNWNRGRFWIAPSIVAGYSFNRLAVRDQARPPFLAALRTTGVSFDAGNSFAWRPQVAVWYDVAPRVGLTVSLAYMGVRPTLSIAGDRGVFKTPMDANATVLTFGLAYGVF